MSHSHIALHDILIRWMQIKWLISHEKIMWKFNEAWRFFGIYNIAKIFFKEIWNIYLYVFELYTFWSNSCRKSKYCIKLSISYEKYWFYLSFNGFIIKTKTDVTINVYKDSLFISKPLWQYSICESLMKIYITFQICNNIWKYPKKPNSIGESSITCSHIWYVDIPNCGY